MATLGVFSKRNPLSDVYQSIRGNATDRWSNYTEFFDYFRYRNDESCKLYFEFGGIIDRKSDKTFVGIDGQKAGW